MAVFDQVCDEGFVVRSYSAYPARLLENQNLRLQSQIYLPREGRARAPDDDELISIEVVTP